MTDEKKKAIMNCTSFDEILNEEYGAMGTPERMKFEADRAASSCRSYSTGIGR